MYDAPVAIARVRIRVDGAVQGVGFRPFVYGTARACGLAGFVRNDARGALIEVEGEDAQIEAFAEELVRRPPPLARIERIARESIAPTGARGFAIASSEATGSSQRMWIGRSWTSRKSHSAARRSRASSS